MDDLFDDLQHTKQGPAAGRRQASTLVAQPSGSQLSAAREDVQSALNAHSAVTSIDRELTHEKLAGTLSASARGTAQQGSLDDLTLSAVLPQRSRVAGNLFGGDDPGEIDGMPSKEAQSSGISRRKQHQMAAQEQKQRDKYSEETEIDVGQLQTLDEAPVNDISMQVAQAPKVHATQKMHSLPELESKGLQSVKTHLAHKYGAHIDFSTLLAVVLPEGQLVETDDVWHEDLLLTEVVSELELGKENDNWGG